MLNDISRERKKHAHNTNNTNDLIWRMTSSTDSSTKHAVS